MDIDRLRYFCTVARTESLQAAASLLHVTPAALSKALKLLQTEVGVPLLIPAGRGIMLTDAGRKFAERAQVILNDLEKLNESTRTDSAEPEILRVGSFEVFTTYFLGPLLQEHPQEVSLLLHEVIPGQLEEALVHKEIDVGITYIPIPHPQLDFMEVTQIEMEVYAKEGAFAQVPFQNIPFAIPISPIQGAPNKVTGLDGWPDHLYPRLARYRVTLMESALEIARLGLAAVYLPKFIAVLHNKNVRTELRLVPLKPRFQIPQEFRQQSVYLVKRKSDGENAIIKKLAKTLRLVCSLK